MPPLCGTILSMKNLFAALAAAVLLLTATPVLADSSQPAVYLEYLPYAVHVGGNSPYTFNRDMQGVGLVIPMDSKGNLSVDLLHYKNSFYNETTLGLVSYLPIHLGPISFGGAVGAYAPTSAYPGNKYPVIGGLQVNVRLGSRTKLNVLVAPCGFNALWCKAAVAFGIQEGIGRR